MIFLYNKSFFSILFLVVLFASACASIASLEGGDKDITPPKLDSLRSTPNFQTNFKKQVIELTFNEWIKLEDPSLIVVSPPLDKKPSIQLKGKTVKVKFDDAEVFRENATYTINFGESIKDLTEGNKAKQRFVFSTGNAIDSLMASFKVLDVLNNEPLENIFILLYSNATDSVVSKERPFYFAKTDKEGKCTIENIRKGNFKVFALNDANLNYKYDLPTEKIGFIDKLLNFEQKDSSKTTLINVFEPQLPIRIKEKNVTTYGHTKIAFSQNATSVKPKWEDIGQAIQVEYQADTLHVWYNQADDKEWKLFVLKDTINIKPTKKADFLKKAKLSLTLNPSKRGRISEKPEIVSTPIVAQKGFLLNFNHLIVKIDTSKIIIIDDTTKLKLVKKNTRLDSTNRRKVVLNSAWTENHDYTITALPGAFTDFYGITNDTILAKVKILAKKTFGDITLKYSGLKADNQYIIQLFNSSDVLVEEKIINKKTEGALTWPTLEATTYKLRIITDSNKNGFWDSGNYYEHRQAEAIFSKKLEELKPNWTLETEIVLPD